MIDSAANYEPCAFYWFNIWLHVDAGGKLQGDIFLAILAQTHVGYQWNSIVISVQGRDFNLRCYCGWYATILLPVEVFVTIGLYISINIKLSNLHLTKGTHFITIGPALFGCICALTCLALLSTLPDIDSGQTGKVTRFHLLANCNNHIMPNKSETAWNGRKDTYICKYTELPNGACSSNDFKVIFRLLVLDKYTIGVHGSSLNFSLTVNPCLFPVYRRRRGILRFSLQSYFYPAGINIGLSWLNTAMYVIPGVCRWCLKKPFGTFNSINCRISICYIWFTSIYPGIWTKKIFPLGSNHVRYNLLFNWKVGKREVLYEHTRQVTSCRPIIW